LAALAARPESWHDISESRRITVTLAPPQGQAAALRKNGIVPASQAGWGTATGREAPGWPGCGLMIEER
jgi:hypothetical protein